MDVYIFKDTWFVTSHFIDQYISCFIHQYIRCEREDIRRYLVRDVSFHNKYISCFKKYIFTYIYEMISEDTWFVTSPGPLVS